MRIQTVAILMAFGGAGLAACGDVSPTSVAETEELEPGLIVAPTFEEDIQSLLVRGGCTDSTCHGNGSGQGDLFLDDDTPWANYNELINQQSTNEPEFVLVKPGDPEASLLVLRLEGRNSPLFPEENASPIKPVDLTNIRTWIEQGALF